VFDHTETLRRLRDRIEASEERAGTQIPSIERIIAATINEKASGDPDALAAPTSSPLWLRQASGSCRTTGERTPH
jgi:hypothetical protein